MNLGECGPDRIFQSGGHPGVHNPTAYLRATIEQGLDVIRIELFEALSNAIGELVVLEKVSKCLGGGREATGDTHPGGG